MTTLEQIQKATDTINNGCRSCCTMCDGEEPGYRVEFDLEGKRYYDAPFCIHLAHRAMHVALSFADVTFANVVPA